MSNKYYALKGKDKFDISKVTVVGSPTITSDGIVSGFTSSDYITYKLPALGEKPFKIIAKVNTGTGETNRYICKIGTSAWNSALVLSNTNQLVFWTVINDGNNSDITPILRNVPANTDLFVKAEWDGNYYWVSISYDGQNWLDSTKRASTYPLVTYNQSGLYIGYHGTGTGVYGSGSIDLKEFKIYVDGELVYSPTIPTCLFERRKEGYDHSKFTVVGTPTITEDGVASGFTADNYVTSGTFNATKPFRIEQECFCNGITTTQVAFQISNISSLFFMVYVKTGGVIEAYDGQNYLYSYSAQKIDFNKKFKIILMSDGTNLMLGWEQNGVEHFDETNKKPISKFTNWKPDENAFIKIGTGTYLTKWVQGSIDLKQFSITVDGKEVFTGAKEVFYALRM